MGLGLDYDWKLLASNKVPISIMKMLALKKALMVVSGKQSNDDTET